MMRKSTPLRKKIVLRMHKRVMKKSILPRKNTVLRMLERNAMRQRKKGLQISITLFTPRQQLKVAAPQRQRTR